MTKDEGAKSKGKLMTVVISLLLVAIIIVSLYYLFYLPEETENTGSDDGLIYLTADEAWDLMNTSTNLNIIDCRSCKCNFNNHTLTIDTEYIKYLYPEQYYNSTKYDLTYDVLVYDNYGNTSYLNESKSFSLGLYQSGKIEGTIYVLDGGISTWKIKGYPVIYKEEEY